MACEKVLIDYALFSKYKGIEKKYFELKSDYDDLKEKMEQKIEYDNSKNDMEQSGSGFESAEQEKRAMTMENGVVNDDTQKIIPLDTVNDESDNQIIGNAAVESNSESGVGNNENENENEHVSNDDGNPWYYLGLPKNVQ